MRFKFLLAVCLIIVLPSFVLPEESDSDFVNIQWKNVQVDYRGASTNQTIKNILSRRSVRAYTSERPAQKDLLAVAQAGLYAPSGKNLQPWHICVITNPGVLERMTDMYKEELKIQGGDFIKMLEENPDFKLFFGAPVAVIVSADEKSEFAAIDCAAAVQNMLIAAQSLDLGTCWIQTHMVIFEGVKGKELIKLLGIPEGFKPIYTFSLGYPAETPKTQPRREDTVKFVK